MLKTLKTKTQLMSAAIMTGLMGVSSSVNAQDFNEYTSTLSERTNNTTQVISYMCYMGGFALCGLGIVGLKQHVENPQNMPLKTPLAKVGFGGMLAAVPSILTVALETTDSGSAGSTMMDAPTPSF